MERLCGLRQLHSLQRLSLADNKLISCLGLEALHSLRELDVSVSTLRRTFSLHSLDFAPQFC